MTHFSKISSATVNISQACGQISDNLNSSADWHGLAAAMLENLAQAPRAGWAFIEHVLPQADQDFLDQLLPFEADERETVPLTEAKPSVGDNVDAMLDQIEQDLHGIKAPSAPAPDPWPGREMTYRARAAVLLAVMRLAKTLGTVEAFAEAMASPSSLTVLCTTAPELERIVVKLLQRLTSEAEGHGKAPADTVIFTATEAVRGTSEATGQIFAALSDGMRTAVEKGNPIVVVATPRAMRAQPSPHFRHAWCRCRLSIGGCCRFCCHTPIRVFLSMTTSWQSCHWMRLFHVWMQSR